MLIFIIVAIPIGFLGWIGWCYSQSTGPVAERLASATRNSMTILAAVGAGIMTFLTQGFDLVAQLFNDPQIASYGTTIKTAIPPEYQGLIPMAGFALVVWARTRTLGK